MLNQSTTQSTSPILWTQLKWFGLNPQEWLLEAISEDKYHIQNKADKEFCFLGIANNKNASETKWEQIQLIHL
jgi:hypothetical protein